MKIKLSIIILSWNTKDLLRQCLTSLGEEFYRNGTVEVMVVDNASLDQSADMVKKEFSLVKLIVNKSNLGFAKGNNVGLKAARGEYVMLLNSDTLVRAGAIEKMVYFLDKQPKEVAAVSPLLLNEDGSVQTDPCYLKFPSPLTVFLYYNSVLRKVITKYYPKALFSTVDLRQPSVVEQLPGAAVMFRAKILKELKGLDEDYPIYFEDTDLSFRAGKKGFKLMVLPEAKITHLGRKSIEPVIKKEGVEKFYLLNFGSLFLFCRKNYSPFKAFLIKAIVLAGIAIGGHFALFKALIKK